MKTRHVVIGIGLGSVVLGGLVLLLARRRRPAATPYPRQAVYPPGSGAQIALFEAAARLARLPVAWARSAGLANILRRESGGRTGVPNFTYGDRAKDPARWPEIWTELRRGVVTARSSATGLGQLLLSNVDKHYPSGRAGIGDPLEEAVGMLRYIAARYGDPENAWRRYGTLFPGY